MWFQIFKILFQQSKRYIMEINRLLVFLVSLTMLVIQLVLFFVIRHSLGSYEFNEQLIIFTMAPWLGLFVFIFSMYFLNIQSFRYSQSLLNLPFPKSSIYKAHMIPTLIAICFLWMFLLIGPIMSVLIVYNKLIIIWLLIPLFWIFLAYHVLLAGICQSLVQLSKKKLLFKPRFVEMTLFLVFAGFYYFSHFFMLNENITWFNPVHWFTQSWQGNYYYSIPLVMSWLICIFIVNFLWSFIDIRSYIERSKVQSKSFTQSSIWNGMIVEICLYMRSSERQKTIWIGFAMANVMVVIPVIVFEMYEILFFYFLIVILGVSLSHISVFQNNEEKALKMLPLALHKILIGKVMFLLLISMVLLLLSLTAWVLVGYRFADTIILIIPMILFVSITNLFRLLFISQAKVGEMIYPLLSMLVFLIIVVSVTELIGESQFINTAISYSVYLVFSAGCFGAYIYAYTNRLKKGSV